ncbi:MAG: DUF1566 domain-containing protein [Campylobacterota bacterium]|nr:DUF1566 domain-containing protein [Campylobacterota bacterium]
MKDLVVKQDSKVVLSKTKTLFDITKKILDKEIVVKNKDLINPKISYDQNRAIEFDDGIEVWVDEETGLFWEIKTKENIKHEYVWSEDNIEEAVFPEALTDDVKDAFSYAKKLNSINYGGFNDWRVPSIDELKTILTKDESKIKGYADQYYYTKLPLAKNMNYYYWSATTDVLYTDYAWYVDFNNGVDSNGDKTYSVYVRCVRLGGQIAH